MVIANEDAEEIEQYFGLCFASRGNEIKRRFFQDFVSTSYLLACAEETQEESNSAFASSLFCFSPFWDQLCASEPR